jgi:hypothetical protein
MSQRSIMQFSLRGIVAIVTGVAILAAILSPWIRTFEPARQQRVGAFIVISTVGLLCGLMLSCYFRYRLERRAGSRLVPLSPRLGLWYSEAMFAGSCALMLFTQFMSVTSGLGDNAALYKMIRINWFMWGMLSAGVVTWIWWRRAKYTVELCEHGVAFPFIFRPWSKFNHFAWNADRGVLSLKTNWGSLEFDVAEENRSEVSRILELYLHEELTNSKIR